ncbi:hypothetical protein C5470_01460 [Photorhabdus stackebrandtii]|uniref:Uncharacterized protein n=1 Tax=Photorhabdus stackebrandtii TaxID=1123042 RepID=A0A7X5TJM9_9GAMM|nr:hypothetical protein [Photorhabdus stackebrandtii]
MLKITTIIALGNGYLYSCLNSLYCDVYLSSFQVAALLAAFTYPSHRVIYAPGEAFICRRAAT